jgi:hypothetical protein
MGEKRNAYKLLMGRRPLGRPRRRWVDNIKRDLGEVGWGDVDWIGLAQDRNRWRAVVNAVTNLRVPRNAGKLSRVVLSSIEPVSLLNNAALDGRTCNMQENEKTFIHRFRIKFDGKSQ